MFSSFLLTGRVIEFYLDAMTIGNLHLLINFLENFDNFYQML
tara:strand:- start:5658 stop:5783 length:126 start_codon:yes stop_codon:yes gene_type:complete